MKLRELECAFLTVLIFCVNYGKTEGWAGSIEGALEESSRSGRNLLILATRPTCGPCQSMKQMLERESELDTLRRQFIIVCRDVEHPDFATFFHKYPVQFDFVPMVYIISPDEKLLYAQAGAVDALKLESMRSETIQHTGESLNESQISENERLLDKIRAAAKDAKLAYALQLISRVASQNSSASSVLRARSYEKQLLHAADAWVDRLESRLACDERIYESSYALARLFVSTPPQYVELRDEIRRALAQAESAPETQIAIQQAKLLVRARIEEQRSLSNAALHSYQCVTNLEANTPAGRFAARRANMLRQQSRMLTQSNP